jgi:NAD-dependent dihydropyrimidine dehydrogenase PreA subunit
MFFNREHKRTAFIQLDPQKCKACWNCIKNCSNQVIGKVDLLWHKHTLILAPDACTGCLKCIEVCNNEAYKKVNIAKQKSEKLRRRTFNNFLINNLLLISGLMIIFSGLALQIGFHMGSHDEHLSGTHGMQFESMQYEQLRGIDTSKIVCGLNYSDWSTTHKSVIVFFSLLMIYHTYIHWKWYKGVITKHLIGKNKQVIILSVLYLLVAVTGLVPWFIDLSGGTNIFRMLFIEIHDKLTFILIVYFVLHFIKRAKWFSKTYAKLIR